MLILGLETSCDETGVALYDTGRGLLANALFSQVDAHKLYGGIVPEIAARYQVSRQHIQVTVNALLEDGFLMSRPNPRHKRSPLFALTAVGRELFRKIRLAESELLDKLFADIPTVDIECTRRTLEAMYFHNLEKGETDASI